MLIFTLKTLFALFTKQAASMRRSTVLSLPLQLVFPATTFGLGMLMQLLYRCAIAAGRAKHYSKFSGVHETQHNDTQHNDTQHNDTRHVDIRHNDTHHNDTQHNDTQHNDTQHNDTQHNHTLYNDIQHNDTRHNDTQHADIRHNNKNMRHSA
jgi:hypothetical protein